MISNATIGYLKEYFLKTFGHKYHKYCKCVLSLCYYDRKNYNIFLNDDNNRKLSEYNYDKLFLIKVNALCDCELKMYNKYMSMNKFDLIAKIKDLETQIQTNQDNFKELEQSNRNENLKNLNLKEINKELNEKIEKINEEMKKLKKEEELQNFQKHKLEENFYDIVIDINSITNVSTEGWKVKFNPAILAKLKEAIKLKKEKEKKELKENPEEQDEENTITLGVLGNNNKGKSFLLSRISKIKLLTGTSIETKGLSVKYPELKGYKGRQIILLDSAGLETPILKKYYKEIEKKEEKENQEKKEEKENQEKKEDNQKSNDENSNQEGKTIIKNNKKEKYQKKKQMKKKNLKEIKILRKMQEIK